VAWALGHRANRVVFAVMRDRVAFQDRWWARTGASCGHAPDAPSLAPRARSP